MDYIAFSPCVRYANILSLKEDYLQPLLAYDHRLLYVREGRMRVEFSERICTLSAGDLLIFPPACPYRFTFYAARIGATSLSISTSIPPPGASIPVIPWRSGILTRRVSSPGRSRRPSAGSAICTVWRSARVCWRISAA